MTSQFGTHLKLSLFGQSHGPAVGCVLEGLPAGIRIDQDKLTAFMARRRPGTKLTSPRKEADQPQFISGLFQDHTCEAPLVLSIANTSVRPDDYESKRHIPRPGHVDFVAHERYGDHYDWRGSGHFSGRITAGLCAAGGIALQILEVLDVCIVSHISVCQNIHDECLNPLKLDHRQKQALKEAGALFIDKNKQSHFIDKLAHIHQEADSLGACVECGAYGLPAGLGGGFFGGLDSQIAGMLIALGGVKGISFGAGFEVSQMTGSQNNDSYGLYDKDVVPISNRAGGILGGLTTGAPLLIQCAVKPTPSIGKAQPSVDLTTLSPTSLSTTGRHDPCIAMRILPVIEAGVALCILDALLDPANPPKLKKLIDQAKIRLD